MAFAKTWKSETKARYKAERERELTEQVTRFRANYAQAQAQYGLPAREFGADEQSCWVPLPGSTSGEEVLITRNRYSVL